MLKKFAPLLVLFTAACSPGSSDLAVDSGTTMTVDAGSHGGCILGNTMADVETKLFRSIKCSACHSAMTLFPTSLDTVSPGLAARVVDKMAETNNPAKGKCAGHALLSRSNPTGGLFVEKVEKTPPSCGDPMPMSMAPLSPGEVLCVKMWATLAAAQ
jgi:hypothetical protein